MMTHTKKAEEQWEVVEIGKERVVLRSPSGQEIELTETPERHISAKVRGVYQPPESKS